MTIPKFNSLNSYKKLKTLSSETELKKLHLRELLKDANRFQKYSIKIDNFFYDFSKQRIDNEVLELLIHLAEESRALDKFKAMTQGQIVNTSENRAALHTLARSRQDEKKPPETHRAAQQIHAVNDRIKKFSDQIRNRNLTVSGPSGFTDAVVVGIGGSYLGCECVYTALKNQYPPKLKLHFLSNVDIGLFDSIIKDIIPERTLWIIISKSYTTTETLANLEQIKLFLQSNKLNPQNHLVTVTAEGSPGDGDKKDCLASFHMFDYIGGRYSVSSAVGGLPLSLAFGYDIFQRFLNGCRIMDEHAAQAPANANIPLISSLLSIWNTNFAGYTAQAVIPYSSALSRLASHVQQLYMESLGKNVDLSGKKIDYESGSILFGEPGTNAQHSFFQLAHQGRPFPIEFIGIVKPAYSGNQAASKGVTNHQELWANMLAQSKALAVGKQGSKNERCFSGNRPSSTIILNDLTPESVGMLISYYEARTVFEGFVLNLNPFDQFGVELGKILASDLRDQIALKNKDAGYAFQTDPAEKWYLNTLFNGKL